MTISQQDIMLLRSLKKTAIIILLLMRAEKSLTGKEIGQLLEINRDTALGYLKSLEVIGLVQNLGKFRGYTFTKSGVQLAFPGLEKHEIPAFIPNNNESIKDNKLKIKLKEKTKTLILEVKQENPAFLENKNLLASCGIGDPNLSRLSDLDYCDPKYLMGIIKDWKKTNKPVALLIHMIKNKQMPENNNDCRSSEVERNKYTNW